MTKKRRWRNTGSLALVASLVCGCTTTRYLWYRIAPDYPEPKTETVALPGLQAPVTVYFEANGVPHIDAEGELDMVRAVGFLHGRYRFFQMDVLRRYAKGELAALVGDRPYEATTTVETDRTMRAWGLADMAEADADALVGVETHPFMKAYTEGVNAGLAAGLPIEYGLLDVAPTPWRIADSFALGRLNAWSVIHNWAQEISRLLLAIHGGIDRAHDLYPGEPWKGPFSLPPEASTHALLPDFAPELANLFPVRPALGYAALASNTSSIEPVLGLGGLSASNAWAVGGARSTSGKPLIASDPHLNLLLPALFYQMHTRAPGLDVIGFTIPGLPYVLIGHNDKVAWATTAAFADAVDLYVEEQNPDAPDQVRGPTGYYAIEKRPLVIEVRGTQGLERKETFVRRTRHGPLLNDVYPDLLPAWAPLVAIQWAAGDVVPMIAGLRVAGAAKSVEDLLAQRDKLKSPAGVVTAADIDGNVAQFLAGTIPIRQRSRGTFPVPGWLADYDWSGVASADTLPWGAGHADAVFVHANNLVRDPTHSEVVAHIDTAPTYRFERIRELIDATPKHDPKTFAAIQIDQLSVRARNLIPFILQDLAGLESPSAEERAARDLLSHWDFVTAKESAAALVFFVTYRQSAILALADEVDDKALKFLLSENYITNPIDQWIATENHPVWDDRNTPEVETRPRVIRAAFRAAVAWITETQGADPTTWSWGREHRQALKHPFGTQRSIAAFVNLRDDPAGGEMDTVWKARFNLGDAAAPFRVTAGPVGRYTLDLGDMQHGLWVVSTGASGWPGSPNYGDQYETWAKGEMLPMIFSWDEARTQAKGVLTLEP